MGWKDWVYGDLVSAADFQSLVQDQTIQRYADSATRSSTLGSAVAEGMVSYLDSTNQVEVYDGSSWGSISSAGSGNAIINGAFEINQRNFSSSSSGGYGFDRWRTSTDGVGLTYTAQSFTPGAAPVAGYEAKNFARLVTTGQTSTGTYSLLEQPIEDVRSFAGQTITISFWAKAASGTPKIALEFYRYYGSGGSPSADEPLTVSAVTISTSWTRYSVTYAMPSISGKTVGSTTPGAVVLGMWVSAGSSFNARASSIGIQSNTFDIWGVQVEAGSTATAFKRNAPSIQAELAACQRYYQRFGGLNTYQTFGWGLADQSTTAIINVPLPVTMRVAPASVEFSTLNLTTGGTNTAVTGLTILSSNSGNGIAVVYPTTSGGLTQYRPYGLTANNSTSGYLGLSAEL